MRLCQLGHPGSGALTRAAGDRSTGDVEFDRPGARCSVASRGNFSRLSPEAAGHLFRIAHEALANTVRHLATTRIRVMLSGIGPVGRLTMDDDGIGHASAGPGTASRHWAAVHAG